MQSFGARRPSTKIEPVTIDHAKKVRRTDARARV
jgi:hypothetical protein